jgi:hypothetical protein
MIAASLLASLLIAGVGGCEYNIDWSAFSTANEDVDRYVQEMRAMDDAIKSDDAEYLSKKVFFPIKLICNEVEKNIKNEKGFLACYSSIFSDEFKSGLYSHKCLDIQVSWNGLRIGSRGQIWMQDIYSGDGYSLFITKVND